MGGMGSDEEDDRPVLEPKPCSHIAHRDVRQGVNPVLSASVIITPTKVGGGRGSAGSRWYTDLARIEAKGLNLGDLMSLDLNLVCLLAYELCILFNRVRVRVRVW